MRTDRQTYPFHNVSYRDDSRAIGDAYARADLARIRASVERGEANAFRAVVAKGKAARRAANRRPSPRQLRALVLAFVALLVGGV